LITVDTELSCARQAQGMPIGQNLEQQYFGRLSSGAFGVEWLMDRMDRRGIKGVFFVDPMPSMVHGANIVERMVEPILARGHEVQLHIHTEWLEWAPDSPVAGKTGRNIRDFTLEDQVTLIGWARDALVSAGAPMPTAFRAGNFGANDDTLEALVRLGLRWDSSYNADYAGGDCRITLSGDMVDPRAAHGILELPVAGIWDRPGHFRPAQVCALSGWEMRQGLHHAAESRAHSFAVVTHSFEMLSRDRLRPNRMVMKRFDRLCETIAQYPRLEAATFRTLREPASPPSTQAARRLAPSRTRTIARVAEQLIANIRFERQLRPA
jgi:peptidoglycan/xylan/chitin deacetylase (PgdA/CDA1 family)